MLDLVFNHGLKIQVVKKNNLLDSFSCFSYFCIYSLLNNLVSNENNKPLCFQTNIVLFYVKMYQR